MKWFYCMLLTGALVLTGMVPKQEPKAAAALAPVAVEQPADGQDGVWGHRWVVYKRHNHGHWHYHGSYHSHHHAEQVAHHLHRHGWYTTIQRHHHR
jgi:hypothetical protein